MYGVLKEIQSKDAFPFVLSSFTIAVFSVALLLTGSPAVADAGSSGDHAVAVIVTDTDGVYSTAPKTTKTVAVQPLVKKLLIGRALYNASTCKLVSTGQWSITVAPKHGKVTFKVKNGTIPPKPGEICSGVSIPFNFAFYEWTSTNLKRKTDNFTLHWHAGQNFDSSDWLAKRHSVTFQETRNKYGWDDYTDRHLPAKSVKKGGSDTVIAKTDPSRFADKTAFRTGESAAVDPTIASSAEQKLTISGTAEGKTTLKAENTKSKAVIGKAEIHTFKNLVKSVSITLIHKKGTGAGDPGYKSIDISDDSIKRVLKKVYKQAVITWRVTRLPTKRLEFDLNKDGKIDVSSWMNDEMQVIRNWAGSSAYDYNIFIVGNPSKRTTCGMMNLNQSYGYVFTGVSGCGDSGNTVAHELGHGQGLHHTTSDPNNIMYESVYDTRLRKEQWEFLQRR